MNTRTVASVSVCFAVISGIVAANLWRDLHAEREVTAALRAGMAGSAGHALAPLPAAGIDAGTAVAPTPQDNADAWLATALAPPAEVAATVQSASISAQVLLMDPQDREARLAELRSTIERSYPGLVEELRLTHAESDRFFGLLAETRLAMEAETALLEREPVDLAAAAEATRNRQALQGQQNASLRALLGDARYAQWQGYQRNQSAWLQAGTYNTALASAGVPLDSTQTRVIALAMIEEQERQKRDIVALARTVNLAYPQTQLQAQEALKRRQEESGQRVLDAASPYLSAQQLGVLRRQIEQQDAVDRAAARSRERAGPAPQQ